MIVTALLSLGNLDEVTGGSFVGDVVIRPSVVDVEKEECLDEFGVRGRSGSCDCDCNFVASSVAACSDGTGRMGVVSIVDLLVIVELY